VPVPVPVPGWVPGPEPAPPERLLGDDTSWSGSAIARARAGARAGTEGHARRVPVRAVLGALLLVVALFAGGGARILVQRSEQVPTTVTGRAPAAGPTAATAPPRSSAPVRPPGSTAPVVEAAGIVVHVVGRVHRPGVRRLPAGSRVADAIRAAGGAAPGAVPARLNLARRLVDGEQVAVPGPRDPVAPVAEGPGGAGGAGGTGGASGAGGPGAPDAVVDLNAATQAQLDALPGVGPVLAGRILAWRTEHGRFTRVDELGEVAGIGPKALERLRPLVTV